MYLNAVTAIGICTSKLYYRIFRTGILVETVSQSSTKAFLSKSADVFGFRCVALTR